MELCSMLCASLDGRKVWERMDTGIYVAVSLCYLPETTRTLLICYTPTQNKKFKIWGEKKKNIMDRNRSQRGSQFGEACV